MAASAAGHDSAACHGFEERDAVALEHESSGKSTGTGGGDDSDVRDMPPWEQHGGVINMPRYVYGANAALMQGSHPGFLITCAYRIVGCTMSSFVHCLPFSASVLDNAQNLEGMWWRVGHEKSTTKEAMNLLQEYMGLSKGGGPSKMTDSKSISNCTVDCKNTGKRMKSEACRGSQNFGEDLSDSDTVERESEATNAFETQEQDHKVEETEKLGMAEAPDTEEIAAIPVTVSKDDQDRKDIENLEESGRESEKYSQGEDQDPKKGLPEFFLVKLTRMGMVYLSVSGRMSRDMVTVLSKLLADMHAGLRAPPQWCHRIFPVQATCSLTKGDLSAVVIQLVKDYLENRKTSTDQPLKYAVAFNRRGVEDKPSNISSSTGDTSVQSGAIGKTECIDMIAGAVQTVTSHTVVDLVNPEMVVMVEVLPLVGSQNSLVCAVSVLPRELVVTKPKLVVKPLVQPKKRKHIS